MEIMINKTLLQLVKGDITKESVDAIVNAANSALAGGAGVDGAIHSAGGPTIMQECRRIGGCPVGQAVITTGGRLSARYVIHTVGPIYRGGGENEESLLASAYRESLKLATGRGIKSVSFPAISAGVYGYPKEEAARIALTTIIDYLKKENNLILVRMVLYSDDMLSVFNKAMWKILGPGTDSGTDSPDRPLV